MSKLSALAAFIDVDDSEIDDKEDGYGSFCIGEEEYRVFTDSEANEAWNVELDNYIDECILAGEEGVLAQYFNREAWKRDARNDGRGHSLSPYDGKENEVKDEEGDIFYIYRVN